MGEYGIIFFPLTTSGGATATPQDALDPKRMPVADSKGRIDYERTFPEEMLPDGLLEHLSSMHVVQHGIDDNNNGKYDLDALGESTFAAEPGKARCAGRGNRPGSVRRRQGRRCSGTRQRAGSRPAAPQRLS